MPHYDVLIIGAGLSGIGAACHLARDLPGKSYLLLEGRAELGGTWSLFRYPGVRSDSDMYTFGYSFKTWDDPRSFADGPAILAYLREAAAEYGVGEHIRYRRRAVAYDWDAHGAYWAVTTVDPAADGDESAEVFTADFVFNCTGYYDYAGGYAPEFPGRGDFAGPVVHPQDWPGDLRLRDRRVVVIGSGATAVTLVPELAEAGARQVTMLQRSPTYVGALPNADPVAGLAKAVLPQGAAHKLIRAKNVLAGIAFFELCRRFPGAMRRFILRNAQRELGDFPVEPHFSPAYDPWTQRFCLAPDGDLFRVIREGRATVVTDHVERFTPTGIALRSGDHLPADVIVTATGLRLLAFGGAEIRVDGERFDPSTAFVYKGTMLSGLPNFFVFVGYSNAPWTLKSDLTSEYATRVLRHVDRHAYRSVTPRVVERDLAPTRLMNLDSGYINRSADELPSQGDRAPWRMYQNYVLDYKMLRVDRVDDGRLAFA